MKPVGSRRVRRGAGRRRCPVRKGVQAGEAPPAAGREAGWPAGAGREAGWPAGPDRVGPPVAAPGCHGAAGRGGRRIRWRPRRGPGAAAPAGIRGRAGRTSVRCCGRTRAGSDLVCPPTMDGAIRTCAAVRGRSRAGGRSPPVRRRGAARRRRHDLPLRAPRVATPRTRAGARPGDVPGRPGSAAPAAAPTPRWGRGSRRVRRPTGRARNVHPSRSSTRPGHAGRTTTAPGVRPCVALQASLRHGGPPRRNSPWAGGRTG